MRSHRNWGWDQEITKSTLMLWKTPVYDEVPSFPVWYNETLMPNSSHHNCPRGKRFWSGKWCCPRGTKMEVITKGKTQDSLPWMCHSETPKVFQRMHKWNCSLGWPSRCLRAQYLAWLLSKLPANQRKAVVFKMSTVFHSLLFPPPFT